MALPASLTDRVPYWQYLPAGWHIFSGGLAEILRARGGFVPVYAALSEKMGHKSGWILPHPSGTQTVCGVWANRLLYSDKVLLEDGVKIFEYTPGFIYAKNFMCDDKFAVCGTINLDYRSLVHHFECGAWMYGTSCIADMKADFLKTQGQSQEIPNDRPILPRWQRFLAEVMQIFSPLF